MQWLSGFLHLLYQLLGGIGSLQWAGFWPSEWFFGLYRPFIPIAVFPGGIFHASWVFLVETVFLFLQISKPSFENGKFGMKPKLMTYWSKLGISWSLQERSCSHIQRFLNLQSFRAWKCLGSRCVWGHSEKQCWFYCWWKKYCTTSYFWKSHENGIFFISTGHLETVVGNGTPAVDWHVYIRIE